MRVFFFSLLFLFILSPSLSSKELKHIVLINSYHQGMGWTDNITKEIIKKYGYTGSQYALHIEYMDTKNIYSKEYLSVLYKMYKKKYSNMNVELIFSSDNHALDFLLEYRNKIFGNVPVVFSGINNYDSSLLENHENYTGIVEYFSIQSTIKTILKIHPDTKHLYVLNDYLKTGREAQKIIKKKIDAMEIDIHVSYSDELSLNALRRRVASLDKKSIVLLGIYFSDKHGVHISEKMLKNEILKESTVPIYTLSEFYVGGAVVGGKVISATEQGKFISNLGVQILNGTNIQMLPVMTKSTNNYIFDYKALKHYGINLKDLPPIAKIQNKEISFYEQYTLIVNLTLFFVILLCIVIVSLYKSIYQRKKSEEKISALNKNLESLVQSRTRELEKTNNNLSETILDLESTQNTLINSIKMAKLGKTVTNISHEVNKYLKLGISDFSSLQETTQEMLRQQKEKELSQKEMESYLYGALNTSNTILKNLNEVSKFIKEIENKNMIQEEKINIFSVKECIEDIVNSYEHKLEKMQHTLHIECDENIYIKTSISTFSQILSNLILHSLMYSFKNTKMGYIQISFQKEKDGKCILCYEDDGSGFKKSTNDLNHINIEGINKLVETKLKGSIKIQNFKTAGERVYITFYSD